MRLVIVRHAEAAAGRPDELRPLTAEGRAQARRLADRLRGEGVSPAAVVCSPLLRARETASALALGEPQVDDRLAPGATPEDFRAVAEDALEASAAEPPPPGDKDRPPSVARGRIVVVVGHQPDCGRAAAALGGGEEQHFPPGGHATIELA